VPVLSVQVQVQVPVPVLSVPGARVERVFDCVEGPFR
jgi:hypothetical protein